MSSLFIESLDLAASADKHHVHTARAANSTESGRSSDLDAHGDTLSIFASSSGQRERQQAAKRSHSLPNEQESQNSSIGVRPRGSVDFDVAGKAAHGHDACAVTSGHIKRCTETEVTSSGMLRNNQHGDTGETLPQLSRHNSEAPRSEDDATADDVEVSRQEAFAEILSRLRLASYQHGNSGETPPQPSPHDSEASRDESDAAADNPDVPHQESVAEILSRLVPKGSHLQLSIDRRDCSMWLVDDNKIISKEIGTFQDPRSVFKEMRQKIAAGCVLIIENLNSNICKALEIEHPNIDRAFLVHHMLRFDDPIFGNDVEGLEEELRLHHSDPNLCAVDFHEGPNLNIGLSLRLPLFEHDKSCIHLDGVYVPLLDTPLELNAMEDVMMTSIQSRTEFRHEQFRRSTAGAWKKVSTRLSYCRLARDSSKLALIRTSMMVWLTWQSELLYLSMLPGMLTRRPTHHTSRSLPQYRAIYGRISHEAILGVTTSTTTLKSRPP